MLQCWECTNVLRIVPCITVSCLVCVILQGDVEKGLEMKKLVLSGFLASEEIYINQLEALLLVRQAHPPPPTHKQTIQISRWGSILSQNSNRTLFQFYSIVLFQI